MTSSIPDNISMDDLHNFLETAQCEDELHTPQTEDKKFTPEFIEKVAQDCLESATERCHDPLVHKVMAMMIIHRMVDWHEHVAKRQLEEGNREGMGAWMRDAGKFQAVMDILCSIAVGPDDFTVSE